MFGMVGAAGITSSAFMTVTATGAMALIVSDAELADSPDPDRALFTLTVLCGVIMVLAGLLRAGKLVRFVSTAVMTGFVTAIGVNIVLSQLPTIAGYTGLGANRVTRTVDLVLHLPHWQPLSVVVGIATILVILAFHRTRMRSIGLVIAVVLGSLLALVLNSTAGGSIPVLDDKVTVPNGLPLPVLPSVADIGHLLLPACALAFVGLVQGSGVSASTPTPDGKAPDASRDFIGQGAGNVLSGLFRGMPVGGSMSATALVVAAGARSRAAIFIAGAVMAVTILFAADTVGHVAMPALAGLLLYIGVNTIKPSRVMSVVRSSPAQSVMMAITFALTLVIRLQFAVLIGVALTLLLFVVQQSNRVKIRQMHLDPDGSTLRETDPVPELPADSVTVLQVFGSLFFASAPIFERQLPVVRPDSRHAVVILRLRGIDQIGLSHIRVLLRYAEELRAVDSMLKIVASEDVVLRQLRHGGLTAAIGEDNVYRGTEWIGRALRQAYDDAHRHLRERG